MRNMISPREETRNLSGNKDWVTVFEEAKLFLSPLPWGAKLPMIINWNFSFHCLTWFPVSSLLLSVLQSWHVILTLSLISHMPRVENKTVVCHVFVKLWNFRYVSAACGSLSMLNHLINMNFGFEHWSVCSFSNSESYCSVTFTKILCCVGKPRLLLDQLLCNIVNQQLSGGLHAFASHWVLINAVN